MPYPDLSFSEVTSAVVRLVQYLLQAQILSFSKNRPFSTGPQKRGKKKIDTSKCNPFLISVYIHFETEYETPEIPRRCPSSLANVMKRCWEANPDKRPEMD